LAARYRYEYVSEALGEDSPAKVAAREAELAAQAEAALRQLTESIGRAKDLK
jgi:hypothetical protein